ncbi:hypothetical protein E2320_014395 [Naja naja]|nr:hypothetical protein E2320_014395 [Naja naja]
MAGEHRNPAGLDLQLDADVEDGMKVEVHKEAEPKKEVVERPLRIPSERAKECTERVTAEAIKQEPAANPEDCCLEVEEEKFMMGKQSPVSEPGNEPLLKAEGSVHSEAELSSLEETSDVGLHRQRNRIIQPLLHIGEGARPLANSACAKDKTEFIEGLWPFKEATVDFHGTAGPPMESSEWPMFRENKEEDVPLLGKDFPAFQPKNKRGKKS